MMNDARSQSTQTESHQGASRAEGTPKRLIGPVQAAALSVGFMGPVMAMALNGIGVAGLVGTKVPYTCIIAALGVLFVAYAFVRLTGKFAHAGSVYALTGATIGPRAGFFSGFALLGTYLFFVACIYGACGVFFDAFVSTLGWDISVPWPVTLIVIAALVLLLGVREAPVITKILMVIGAVGIGLMLILAVIVIVQVAGGGGPHGEPLSMDPVLPGGASMSAVMTASVFAFLSWAGFESCTSLAEETRNPRRAIPIALLGSVILGGVIYVVVMYAQTVGFGTSDAGVASFAGADSSLIEIASMYTGPMFARLLALSAFAVAFASALSSTSAASRLLFALARDGFGPRFLARTPARSSTPRNCVTAVVVLTLALSLFLLIFQAQAFETYYWFATIAVLCLIVAYAMTSVGAIVAAARGTFGLHKGEMIIPLVALAYLGYVYFVQAWGQEAPFTYFPWIAGAWCLVGLVVALVRPDMAKNIGDELLLED
mgnify:FL=1